MAAIFGLLGACRTDELVKITVDDITNHGNLILVKIPKTKTCVPRSFTVSDDYLRIVENYRQLRPDNVPTNRFFLNYQKGKCTSQVIGKNKFTAMPKRIAEFLKLPQSEKYTGHSFRRTSASVLANAGADMLTIKRHGGWKSSTVAEGYIENSLAYKKKTEKMISSSTGKKAVTSTVTSSYLLQESNNTSTTDPGQVMNWDNEILLPEPNYDYEKNQDIPTFMDLLEVPVITIPQAGIVGAAPSNQLFPTNDHQPQADKAAESIAKHCTFNNCSNINIYFH